MSTSNSNKGRNGLRILWLPGRKKNHHKGRYDVTNKNVTAPHKQKKNEPWALGGSHGQHELMKTDIPGMSALPNVMSVLPAAVPAAGVADTIAGQTPNDVKPAIDADTKLLEGGENKDECSIDQNNTATLALRDSDKKKIRKDNSLDSIEKMIDEADAVIVPSTPETIPKTNGSLKRRKSKKSKKNRNKHRNKESDDEKEDNDKTVKCLYYTLMCCECSIS